MALTSIEELVQRIDALEKDMEEVFEARRKEFRYRLERRKVVFEAEARRQQRRFRIRLSEFLARARPMTVLTAPVIYAMIVPTALLDLSVTLYQHICFRAYGIARVRRSDYVVVDRQALAYLNAIEKLNCIYCGYSNGVYAYAVEIAARTEQYWCPIKHASKVSGAHGRYPRFADFGDAERYRGELQKLREALWEEAGRSK